MWLLFRHFHECSLPLFAIIFKSHVYTEFHNPQLLLFVDIFRSDPELGGVNFSWRQSVEKLQRA